MNQNFNLTFESETIINAFMQWIYLKWGRLVVGVIIFLILYFSAKWLISYFLREREASLKRRKEMENFILEKADDFKCESQDLTNLKFEQIDQVMDRMHCRANYHQSEAKKWEEKAESIYRMKAALAEKK